MKRQMIMESFDGADIAPGNVRTDTVKNGGVPADGVAGVCEIEDSAATGISNIEHPGEGPADKKEDKIKRKRKIRILYAFMGVSIAAVVFFAGGLGYELYTSWKSQQYYTSMTSDIETRPRDIGNINLDDLLAQQAKPSEPADKPTVNPEDVADEPDIETGPEWKPYVDFESLGVDYPGIAAWLLSEGTYIDYPIMQGGDNSYYLNHLPDGTKHRSGSVFLDHRSSTDFSDRNSVLYGHMARAGDMFGSLKYYRDKSYFDTPPVMYVFTPEKDYALVLFAGYLLDSGVEVPPISFKDDAAFERHISDIKQRSFFKTDIEVTAEDRIVSLATCAYDYINARWIIVGKLVEIGSSRLAP